MRQLIECEQLDDYSNPIKLLAHSAIHINQRLLDRVFITWASLHIQHHIEKVKERISKSKTKKCERETEPEIEAESESIQTIEQKWDRVKEWKKKILYPTLIGLMTKYYNFLIN